MDVLRTILRPAYELLPSRMDSRKASVLLIAIGLQESRFEHRRQIGGPARGFWQFELGGGVRGVLTHPATASLARDVCSERSVLPQAGAVYRALETDDVLAACFARLLLWTDPKPLPAVEDVDGGWACYLRNWRPGKPHPGTWQRLHQIAVEAVA